MYLFGKTPNVWTFWVWDAESVNFLPLCWKTVSNVTYRRVHYFNFIYFVLLIHLCILLTVPSTVTPPPLSGWGSPGYSPTLALQVSVRLGWKSVFYISPSKSTHANLSKQWYQMFKWWRLWRKSLVYQNVVGLAHFLLLKLDKDPQLGERNPKTGNRVRDRPCSCC